MVYSKTGMPKVSVIITNYNYGRYLDQAITSVLHQTYKNIELIIIDDGSIDNSDSVIRKYLTDNPSIKYINQENSGANVSRNKGIDTAAGEYIFLLDADNWLNNDHIEVLYEILAKSKADVVYSNLQHFGGDNDILEVPEFDMDILKVTNFIDTSALIKKNSIGKNRFDLWLNQKSSQDWDFFLGLALEGLKIVKAPKKVSLNYRVHDKQRGNSFKSVAKIEQSIEVYNYITNKYYEQFPEQFNAQIKWTNSLVVEYAQIKKEIIQIKQEVAQKEQQISSLINSKSYRIGRVVTDPWRRIKRILNSSILKRT